LACLSGGGGAVGHRQSGLLDCCVWTASKFRPPCNQQKKRLAETPQRLASYKFYASEAFWQGFGLLEPVLGIKFCRLVGVYAVHNTAKSDYVSYLTQGLVTM
jgi:hypothetical protein